MSDIVVVKIGGSTLGRHDTTMADIAELHRRGLWPVVVHGGGPVISDWLERLHVPTRFEDGLRVTDEASLEVVVAVLAGLVNKQIVASLQAAGVPAVGLSGADGGMLHCRDSRFLAQANHATGHGDTARGNRSRAHAGDHGRGRLPDHASRAPGVVPHRFGSIDKALGILDALSLTN